MRDLAVLLFDQALVLATGALGKAAPVLRGALFTGRL
jgi:hypothetical protein